MSAASRNLLGELWSISDKGDRTALAMYLRHYSAKKRPQEADPLQFVGPGSPLVLIRDEAVFVWRKFIDDCPLGGGINCAIFRNEGPVLSSTLIREADSFAWQKWPDDTRHYTYVDPREVQSTNPGWCFICAGWKKCGTTAKGLHVLENLKGEA